MRVLLFQERRLFQHETSHSSRCYALGGVARLWAYGSWVCCFFSGLLREALKS